MAAFSGIFRSYFRKYLIPPERPVEEIIMVKYFSFSSQDSLTEWEDKVFNKKVKYRIETLDDGESCVHAVSDGACSAKYYKLKLETEGRPFISWKWRIKRFPKKEESEDILNKKEDDFAARFYVIFPGPFFSNSKVLEYVWAKDLEAGTMASSPYSENIKLFVVESGLNQNCDWVFEERDICQDYRVVFNSKPNMNIGAIAFMCDSDSTRSNAEAFFDEIRIYHKR